MNREQEIELRQMEQALKRPGKARDFLAAADRFLLPNDRPEGISEELDELICALEHEKYELQEGHDGQ